MITTSLELSYNKKDKCFKIKRNYVDGVHCGQISGEKIYHVDNHYVHLSWGNGVPIAVYNDLNDMVDRLEKQYNVKPTINK